MTRSLPGTCEQVFVRLETGIYRAVVELYSFKLALNLRPNHSCFTLLDKKVFQNIKKINSAFLQGLFTQQIYN